MPKLLPPVLLKPLEAGYSATAGDDVQISCDVAEASPAARYAVFFKNIELDSGSANARVQFTIKVFFW